MDLARPDLCLRPARPRPPQARGVASLRAALALAALVLLPAAASAGQMAGQVLAIEGEFGSRPPEVISRLAPLEAQARAGDTEDQRAFLAAWGYAHLEVDKPVVADAAIEELANLGERTHDAATLASAYTLKASALEFAGQDRAAFGWVETALPYMRASNNPDLGYWVFSVAADLATHNGQLEEAIRLYDEAAAAARATDNPRREAQAELALAPLRIVKGQLSAALRDTGKARALAERAQYPSLTVAAWVMEAQVDDALGNDTAASRARRRAAAAQQEVPAAEPTELQTNPAAGADGWLSTETDALQLLADLHLSAGNYAAARDLALRVRTQAQARKDGAAEAQALIDLGLAELGLGQVQVGMRDANAGLALIRPQRNAELLLQLNRYAAALERRGETAQSWERLREALLLETELWRRDRESTVIALQRESSYLQRQRQLEQLQHDNALQAAEISRRSTERTLGWLLAAAMALGVIVAWQLYLRARESNRQLARNNETLAYASLHDTVTGLFNRRAMEADMQALERVPCTCVSLSLKQFSLIVGNIGHHLGDVLLCQIAERLEAAARRFDGQLYRVDGVNFGVIYRFGGYEEERLREAAEALMATMDAPFEIGHQDLIVHVGLGSAALPKDADSAQEAARLAELAKLEAYGDPGNTWRIYDATISEGQQDRLQMEARMLKALAHGGFELYYQGQIDLRDNRFGGFEALLRWHDEDGRMVSPAQFIPVAEESGVIVKLGAWVLRQACLQAKAWADAGLGKPMVAVNISPRQFNHPEFLSRVRETLRETGVDPSQIELEITEGSVMNDAEASVLQLAALRRMGLQLAIDDFGTGYSSLAYLRRFPINRLKIDRAFVMRLGHSAGDDAIVRTVIELAHSLGLSVTAEGVETAEQETMLRGWRCDVVQGFLHSKPGPAAGAAELLQRQRASLADAA